MRQVMVALSLAALILSAAVVGQQRVISAGAQAFAPDVSVIVSDDTPGSHPDITTTIEAQGGPALAQVEVLTPAGGGIASDADIPDGVIVGWVAGFATIPAADGSCTQRYVFEVPLLKQSADVTTFPDFLRELAPGPHHIRFAADIAGTPVNIIVDDVVVEGEPRLQTTSYIGDPAQPSANCGAYRSRVILSGMASPSMPVTSAPPSSGPRVYNFTLTARDGEVAERTATASVAALRPRIDGDTVRWDPMPGAASYRTDGSATYTTNCALIRRLVIRQESRDVGAQLGAGATSIALPAPPGPDYELAQTSVRVSAFDADGVLLARAPLDDTRDFASCSYAPGTEPVLTVDPVSGPCDGTVTFHGSRFPTDLNVEITMPYFGTDGGGEHVVTGPVSPDGSFALTAALPAQACSVASQYPQGHVLFFAYNAAEPKALSIFAAGSYAAAIPPGFAPPPIIAPTTGDGAAASRSNGATLAIALALAALACAAVAGGALLRRR